MHELFALISKRNYGKTNMHVVEIFGGHGGVTRIAIRRGLGVGKNFDIALGIDLLKAGEQLYQYIQTTRRGNGTTMHGFQCMGKIQFHTCS